MHIEGIELGVVTSPAGWQFLAPTSGKKKDISPPRHPVKYENIFIGHASVDVAMMGQLCDPMLCLGA
jgi:hypothetical protein